MRLHSLVSSACESMTVSVSQVHVFIPGKNWKLSLAELISFLEAREVVFKVEAFSRDFFVLNIQGEVPRIEDLGGTIKIGALSKTIPTELFEKAFLLNDKQAKNQIEEEIASSSAVSGMLEKASRKYLFGVSAYCTAESLRPLSARIQRFVGSSVKRSLAEHEVRSDFMGFSRDREQPQLTHVEVLKKNLVESKGEVLLCLDKEQAWLAVTTAVHDPFEFQKRDVGKPNQRKIFAIPPRLARIMVNLSACKSGRVLLDPFCGVGTILQEALLAKAEVVGVDTNPWCVEAATENLEWLRREYGLRDAEFRVLKGDALALKRIIGSEVDCIATEPDLGPALRDVPTTPYAEKIVNKLTPLYSGFLREAFNVLRKDGRLVLVTPYLKTRSGKPVKMRIEEKAEEIGFKKICPFIGDVFGEATVVKENMRNLRSFIDVAERHKTGREIHVLQK